MPPPKKPKKTSRDFPVLFYRSIPAEKIQTPGSSNPPDLQRRQTLIWAGVIAIMIFLIALWGINFKNNLKISSASANNQSLFETGKNELSEIFRQNNEKYSEARREIKNLLQKAALAAPASTSTFTPQQIEELKRRFEYKKD